MPLIFQSTPGVEEASRYLYRGKPWCLRLTPDLLTLYHPPVDFQEFILYWS